MTPAEYIESIFSRLAATDFVINTSLLREYSNSQKGHLRMRLTFTGGSFLEFYEYIEAAEAGNIHVLTCAFHWSTAARELIQRWDNTPHHPELENFPHHIHLGETVKTGQAMDIFCVLDEIERELKSNAQ